ncbi:hypothetical protein DKX38_004328 [Salix brachista]|uniref:Disease resistance N-terminal domain-containing protein n=1 Tax=Salix brachista TaxID=2182728 RepID=A0A5N5N9V9_9ROSI|nr:hypothetical protein DKX38_004328 [Salix brachista]
MSEGIVTFLITKLRDFLLERGKELETVKNEAEYVSDELAFMKAFLRLADAEENDSALRLLVKKVRDVAYDTEDTLDEFRLCLANDNGHGIFSCFRKICRSVKDARARRRIASKIQAIASKIQAIKSRVIRKILAVFVADGVFYTELNEDSSPNPSEHVNKPELRRFASESKASKDLFQY